ncbi:hypothetical protein ACFPOB_12630 [Bosea eneae]|uniref:Uncharacterized protein n=1 Tax=Bosea eneae TaxID=151454 RepID=A0ABW0ITT6_9HYPH
MKKGNEMHETMTGGMLWGMGITHLAFMVLILLTIAALIKYLFFR